MIDKMKAALRKLTRSDSWQNVVTGLGTSVDKALHHRMYPETWYDEHELEDTYYSDAFSRRVVTEIVKASLRPGWNLTAPSELETEQSQIQEAAILDLLAALRFEDAYREARYWGRLYGRGALLVVTDDSSDLSEPLEAERVQRFIYVEALTSMEFTPAGVYYTDPMSPKFGEPEIWTVHRASGGVATAAFDVHETRLIMTGGETTSLEKRVENSWRDASVLQSTYKHLSRLDAGLAGIGHMMTDSSQAVLKIRHLTEMMGGGEDLSVFTNRMRVLEFARSLHIMPVDADGEDFSYVERSFAGIADLVDRLAQTAAGAASMPLTLFWGQSPAGLSATGESDISLWDDQVRAEQTEIDEPNIEWIVRLAAYATGATEPESWGAEFNPIRQMSHLERTEHQKIVAEMDQIYVAQGILEPEEIAIHRFGGDVYDDTPVMVDVDGRRALLESDVVRATEGTGVEPMAEVPTDVAVAVDPSSALNGAQMDKMLAIVKAVALEEIPRDSGIAMLTAALPISERVAESIMGSVGLSFKPKGAAPETSPFAPPPIPPTMPDPDGDGDADEPDDGAE